MIASASANGKPDFSHADGGEVREVLLADIRLDGGTQVRAAMCPETLGRYTEAMKAGEKFPPITVYAEDGEPDCFWLSDGFHRLTAWSGLGHESILAAVRPGGLRAAFLHALQANVRHGLPLTGKDKRAAALAALVKRETGLIDASDREIARLLGVSNFLVSTVRQEREWALGTNTDPAGRKKGYHTARGLTPAERCEARLAAARLTWDEMVRLRPALAELLAEAKAVAQAHQPGYCLSRAWDGPFDSYADILDNPGDPRSFLARIVGLVGWEAPGPAVLCTYQAFDLACDTIFYAMPRCQPECPCGGFPCLEGCHCGEGFSLAELTAD